MKKIKLTLQRLGLAILVIFSFSSCDQDFASIGSGIIGNSNFNSELQTYSVITYNKPLDAIQSNGFSSNLLGHHNDPIFGTYTASTVAQVFPSEFNSEFGDNLVLDSIVLTIPYFSTAMDSEEEDGDTTYELDSVYGSTPINLSIYKSDYFLRNFDPTDEDEFNDPLVYFSDYSLSDGTMIDEMASLQGELLYEDDEFIPSPEAIVLEELDDEGEVFESATLAPALRVHLNNPNSFWQEQIFDKEGEPELSNANNFSNHFRGIYFKAEAMGVDGNMTLLNLANSNANITIYYKTDKPDEDEDGIPDFADVDADGDGVLENGTDADEDGIADLYDVNQTDGDDFNLDGIDDSFDLEDFLTYVLSFSGQRVNFFENNLISIPEGDDVNGDEKLFLKGGPGNMAIINLFSGDEDGNSMELDEFKSQNWLINEARLVFYVDQTAMLDEEPDRIFIYDVENNNVLIDYTLDQSVGDNFSQKVDHLHPLERVDDDPDGQGIRYKIEITEHINNIFLRDSVNRKLGLLVTSDVQSIERLQIQNEDDLLDAITSGAGLTPRSTVLIGNNTADVEKKVELEIYYSEPDN